MKVKTTRWFDATKKGRDAGYAAACRVTGVDGTLTCLEWSSGSHSVCGMCSCASRDDAVKCAERTLSSYAGAQIRHECDRWITKKEFYEMFDTNGEKI